MNWLAFHFFIHTYEIQDIFLRDYLQLALETLKEDKRLQQYFFIRYWQGGPHIRLRFIKTQSEDMGVEMAILSAFDRFNRAYPNNISLESEQYYQNHTFDGVPVSANALYWFSSGSVVAKPYEPEFERYGGQGVMDHSERLFEASSDLVLELLKDPKMTISKKMIISLDLFQIAACLAENQSQFYHIYSQIWSSHKSEHLNYNKLIFDYMKVYQERQRQIIGAISQTPYAKWHQCLKAALEAILTQQTTYPDGMIARNSLLASHIHMTNNRLGVSPQFEFLLSEVSALIHERRVG